MLVIRAPKRRPNLAILDVINKLLDLYNSLILQWWSRRDLNPHASRHMTLNHACLPIPPLDQNKDLIYLLSAKECNKKT